MTDPDLDFELDTDDLCDLDADHAAVLDASLAALERDGGIEAAFRAAVREELEGFGDF